MPNITISIEKDLIKKSREYAKSHNTTLNNMIRALLKKNISNEGSNWLEEYLQRVNKLKISSEGKKWTRKSLHRV